MKRAMLLAVLSVPAVAQERPQMVGYIGNRDGGQIIFMLHQGSCPKGQFVVYTTGSAGDIGASGCYSLVGDNLVTRYESGDMYSYPWEKIILTEDFKAWASKGKEYR